jgi:hypothetical protein
VSRRSVVDDELYLKVDEVGRRLSIGRTKVYALLRQYRLSGGTAGLRSIKLDGAVRVPVSAISELARRSDPVLRDGEQSQPPAA